MDYKILNFPDAMKLASILNRHWVEELEELNVLGILSDVSDEEIEIITELLGVDMSLNDIVTALKLNQTNDLIRYYVSLGVEDGR